MKRFHYLRNVARRLLMVGVGVCPAAEKLIAVRNATRTPLALTGAGAIHEAMSTMVSARWALAAQACAARSSTAPCWTIIRHGTASRRCIKSLPARSERSRNRSRNDEIRRCGTAPVALPFGCRSLYSASGWI